MPQLSSLQEEDRTYKKRRTSSHHDPLGRTISHATYGERYQSAVALAASGTGRVPEDLQLREKADMLSIICDPLPGNADERGKIISVEAESSATAECFFKALRGRLDVADSRNVYSLFESRPASITNSSAMSMWKVACLHQAFADLKVNRDQYSVLKGYVMTVANDLAEQDVLHPLHQQPLSYRHRWMSNVNMLRHLPAPDYLICLQNDAPDDVNVVSLKGGAKLIVVRSLNDYGDGIINDIIRAIQ
jgi:hypothetical protein